MSNKIDRREFLKNSTKVAAGASLIANSAKSQIFKEAPKVETDGYGFYKKNKWRNWSLQVNAQPSNILKPKNLNELRSIILNSDSMRFVGSSHSISGIIPNGQTLINTENFTGIISMNEAKQEVTAYGGMKLRQFSNQLARLGWALPSTGDTFYQSIAGLTSTGTHGTGMQWGSCSDKNCLVGMKVLLADGTIMDLHEDNPGDRELLSAFRVGLGALGYVVTITFKVVPIHNLEHYGKTRELDDALDPKHLKNNDHYEFAYSPYTNKCITFERNITKKQGNKKFERQRRRRENFTENWLAGRILALGSLRPQIVEAATKRFLNSVKDSHDIGRCDHIMTMPRTVPSYLMEYAIPLENARKAIDALKELTFELKEKPKDERFYVNLPCQVRFVRGDQGNLISPGAGRDTCWFGVGSHYKFKNSERFFKPLEKKLIELGGRPHWGKLFYTNPTDKYEHWDKYTEIRNKLDPSQKFSNDYMKRLDGLVGKGAKDLANKEVTFKKGDQEFTHF